MLVLGECGACSRRVALLGHLPATAILDAAAAAPRCSRPLGDGRAARGLPAGAARPTTSRRGWTVDPGSGWRARRRADGARRRRRRARSSGTLACVPDAPGADLLVGVALRRRQARRRGDRGRRLGVAVEATTRYDATRSLGHVTLKDAPATRLDASARTRSPRAWYLAQALIAAESLGSVETALDVSVAVRQGAPHVRPRDRLLPGRQALAHRGPAPARQRPLAALLRRLGAQRRARRSSRSPPAPRARSPGARSTRPRAR